MRLGNPPSPIPAIPVFFRAKVPGFSARKLGLRVSVCWMLPAGSEGSGVDSSKPLSVRSSVVGGCTVICGTLRDDGVVAVDSGVIRADVVMLPDELAGGSHPLALYGPGIPGMWGGCAAGGVKRRDNPEAFWASGRQSKVNPPEGFRLMGRMDTLRGR